MRSLRERAEPFFAAWRYTPAAPRHEAAFAAFALERVRAQASLLMVAAALFSVLFWPADLWVARAFPDVAQGFLRWRVGTPLLALAHFATARLPAPRARFAALSVAFGLLLGWATSYTGGLERPWAHVLAIVVLGPMVVPLAWLARVAVTAALAASLFVGFVASQPAALRAPHLPFFAVMLAAMALLSALLGHTQYLLLRRSFLSERALVESNELLEARVAERTLALRQLLARVETAREDERARISRELHDALGQELTALRYALGYARQRYEVDAAATRANLAELDALLERTRETLRALLRDLRPQVLEDLGVAPACDWLLRSTSQWSGVATELEVEGAAALEGLPRAHAVALFRVLQEALSNALRHAQATRVSVRLAGDAQGGATLEVRDDGVGLEGSAARALGSLGLLTMRERAEALGGAFELRSRPQVEGTLVRVTLPPSAAPAAQGPQV